jgi:chromosome segregation ATPase
MERVIGEIRNDVEKLLRERSETQAHLAELTAQVNSLKNSLVMKENHIAELEDSIKTLKIAKSLNGGVEKTDAKLKINELVREIDKCIALLHK